MNLTPYNTFKSLQELLDSCLQELNAKANVLKSSSEYKVTMSQILDNSNNELAAGSGNGENSEQKSIAESIEHHCFLTSRPNYFQTNIEQVKQQKEFSKFKHIHTLDTKATIDVTEIQHLTNPSRTCLVPTNMIAFGHAQRTNSLLKEFSSSSGCSFHRSFDEAINHGLLELIERNHVSLFLLKKLSGSLITFEEEHSLNQKFNFINSSFKGKVELIKINQNSAVHTVVAIFRSNDVRFPLPQSAHKTAWTISQAIDGALSELTQILYLYSEEEKSEDLNAIEILKNDLQHQDALWLENLLIVDSFHITKELYAADNEITDQNKKEKFIRTVEQIQNDGFSILFQILKKFNNSCCVVQVVIPGFEKYNLIRLGTKVPTHV